ncbi:MAG: tetratricopeptide repeat protein [Acidobacteriota bacterium]|nr:tetratricopeptide repeat protein [Acidobacteriota bacterium]
MRFVLICIAVLSLGITAHASDSLTDRIRTAQNSGDYAEAARLYGQLIASGTDTPEIRSNRGVMLHLGGRNREALEQFRIALQGDSNLASANLFAGVSAFELGELKTAVPYLEKARQLDPDRPAPLLALGKVYVGLREYGRANELYAKAVALDTHLAEAWYGLGVTRRSLAEEILNRAARRGETKDAAGSAKVQELLNGAVQALTRAIDLDPNSARAHLLMAESLSDAGKLVEAVPEYQAALKLDPHLDAAYLGLASEYWKQRQFDQALPLLRYLLERSPRDPETNAMMADISEHNGDMPSAQRFAQTALAGNPDLIETHVVLARVYLSEKRPELAIDELRKVIFADPDGSYHFLLSRACHQVGDEQGAKDALAEFQRLRSGTAKR